MIFITGQDTLGDQLPIYHIRRRIDETGKTFDDKAYLIYVNASIQDDTELGRLMLIMREKSVELKLVCALEN